MPIDLDRDIAALLAAPPPSRTSGEIPEGDVEVLLERKPGGRYLRLRVRGLDVDGGKALRDAWRSSVSAWVRADDLVREKVAEEKDPVLAVVAELDLAERYEQALSTLKGRVSKAARAVCEACIVGWEEGEVVKGGVALTYPDGLPTLLDRLDDAGLTGWVAGACLSFSTSGRYPTAKEQWAALEEKEKPEPARPFAGEEGPSP